MTTTPSSAATPRASGERPWTPGPLKVRHSPNFSLQGNVHIVYDRLDFPVAFVPAWDAPGPGEIDGTEEAKANDYLIAATPALYEALSELLDALDVCRVGGSQTNIRRSVTARQAARLALAAATQREAGDVCR